MTEYIVNPIYIYIIEASGSIHHIADMSLFLSIIALVGISILLINSSTDTSDRIRDHIHWEIKLLEKEAQKTKEQFISIRQKIDKLKDKDDREILDQLNKNAVTVCENFREIKNQLETRDRDIQDILSIHRLFKKAFKWFGILLVVSIIVNIFIPSKEAGYKILLSILVTPDSLHMAIDASKEYIDWAIQSLVNSITNMR